MLLSSIQRWFGTVCNCDINNSQTHSVTCLDDTTANITTMVQSYKNYTAQIIIDLIANYMQEQTHSVVYLQSGWVICLNPDCEWKFDNTSVTNVTPDNDNFMPLVVGLAVGTLLLCTVMTSLLCIIVIVRRINKNPG